ncbi:DNA-formamidopyrimidine glycosylase family protein [Oerskovia flava]|uniref:DNA-formamidopyrimidine glycosylase family protein n=1 Tax=Oerskovia flava TaxID=2986422 RepID=UPI00223EDB35|nr:DNA-formamidopyrimidine glycosylase family protein [Oerskovia sp. JB1-3-2]
MPEGDVVRRTADRLDAALSHRTLTRAELRWPDVSDVGLLGRTVLETTAYGKHLLTRLDDGRTLHTHLRMEGQWRVDRTGSRGAAARGTQVRAVLANQWWTCTGNRLGMLDLLRTRDEARITGPLGPDILAPDFLEAGLDVALERIRAADARGGFHQEYPPNEGLPVADALLSQRGVAGIGTYYAAEALFARRQWPWTPVRDVADLRGIVLAARTLMRTSVEHGIDARGRHVHARAQQACHTCGTPVAVAPANRPPYERPIFYCPTCQPRA